MRLAVSKPPRLVRHGLLRPLDKVFLVASLGNQTWPRMAEPAPPTSGPHSLIFSAGPAPAPSEYFTAVSAIAMFLRNGYRTGAGMPERGHRSDENGRPALPR